MAVVVSGVWRVAVGAVLLLVLSNGPLLRFAVGVLGRPGHWNDWAVWPFFAVAAAVSTLLAWKVWRVRELLVIPVGQSLRNAYSSDRLLQVALVALGWYSATALASSLWSVYPSATLWRSIVYLGLAMLALALAGFSEDELAAVLVLASSVAVAGSLIVIALLNSEGIDQHGNWIGVYTNRNSLAPMAAIGVISGLRWLLAGNVWLPITDTWHRVGAATLVVASLVIMAGAGSRTATVALVAAVAVASLIALVASVTTRSHSRRPIRVWLAALGSLTVIAAAVGAVVAAWDIPTFAQRRAIWSLVWDRVQQRPLGGYGFFAFWEVPDLIAEQALLQRGSAHNSLVETALGLGLLGVVPFVILVGLAVFNSSRNLWQRPTVDAWMWSALTVFVIVENMAESFVLWFSHIWVLLLAAALRSSRIAASAQPQRPDQPGTDTTGQSGKQVAGSDIR